RCTERPDIRLLEKSITVKPDRKVAVWTHKTCLEDSREIRWLRIWGRRGRLVLPSKVQEARPSIVQGSNCFTLVIIGSTRGEKIRYRNCVGSGKQLACSPFTLGIAVFGSSSFG
uniref:Uncharacterized protein n=1 Tax=Fundulus heteroclitus TaxID=8078 RepID=A0A3Q2P9F9_FUNHE